ncbi:UNKNOWN [Stylonychia lemnae]|uniref:Uncharacterized protein n=1 Tax=Stylonychia lemnae TaxID=5949 RepID=A0A078B4Z6_STYLE|nr:UNKNOWN [Stylonychia lemnae]|eukprot:CDW89494.1 UNKNOWN [Stylonychia lemnae]
MVSTKLDLQFVQKIKIDLDPSIEVQSSQNVFLLRMKSGNDQLGAFFVIAFGLNNYAAYQMEIMQNEFKTSLLVSKSYQLIQPADQRGVMTVARFYGHNVYQAPNSRLIEYEFEFLLGTASQQRVTKLRFNLVSDPSLNFGLDPQKLEFQASEYEYFEPEKGIRSRISSFFSKIVSSQQEQEIQQIVKDILVTEYLIFIITSKEIITIGKESGKRFQEEDYVKLIRQYDEYENSKINNLSFREIKSLQFVAADCTITSDQRVYLNLFVEKRQVVQYTTSYQYIPQTHLIQITQCFAVSESQVVRDRDDVYQQIDLSNHSNGGQISRGFSCSVPSGIDNRILVFLEFENTKSLVVELSSNEKLNNQSVFPEKRLVGYNVDVRDILKNYQEVKVITSRNVVMFEIDAKSYEDFSNLKYISLKDSQQQPLLNEQKFQKEGPRISIASQEDLKKLCYGVLDKIANIELNQRQVEEREQKLSAVRDEINDVLQQVSENDFKIAFSQILQESIDQRINDQHFNVNQPSQEDLILHTLNNSLIQASLKMKQNKLKVLNTFYSQLILLLRELDAPLRPFEQLEDQINQCEVSLTTASQFKKYWDRLLEQRVQRSITYKNEEISLEIRMIFAALQHTAETQFGLSQEIIRSMSTSSEKIVFSSIGKFEQLLQSLIDLSIDVTIQHKIKRLQQENQDEILFNGSNIIYHVVNNTIQELSNVQRASQMTYLQSEVFYEKLFDLCTGLRGSVVNKNRPYSDLLKNLSYLLLDIIRDLNPLATNILQYYRDKLIDYVDESSQNPQDAVDMAIKYDGQQKLCELIYRRDKSFYPQLLNQLQRRPQYISQAIAIIYDLDKNAVYQSTINQEQVQHFQCIVEKNTYAGFKLFDIFEGFLPAQKPLVDFLTVTNKRILALFLLRNGKNLQSQELLKDMLPRTKFIDTLRVFSSLSKANIQILEGNYSAAKENPEYKENEAVFIQSQSQYEIYEQTRIEEQKFNMSPIINQDDQNIKPTNVDLLSKAIIIEQNKRGKMDIEQFVTVFKLLHSSLMIGSIEDPDGCILHLWNKVVESDNDQIQKIQGMLPVSNYSQVFTDFQIECEIKTTKLYELARKIENYPEEFRSDLQLHKILRQKLMEYNPELERGLSFIYQIIDTDSHSQIFSKMDDNFSIGRTAQSQSLFGSQMMM